MSAILLALVALSTFCVSKFLRGLWHVNFALGPRPLFSPLTIIGAVLPASRWSPGNNWAWLSRRSAYFGQSHDVVAYVPWLLGPPVYFTSSIDVMKQLLGAEHRIHLEKPLDLTLARLWGHSVTSANGEVWRRHRKVVSPAFSNRMYPYVWKTAVSLFTEMVEREGWSQRNEVVFDMINPLVVKFTFIINCCCSFGFTCSWSSMDAELEKFPEALRLVSETLIPRLIIPSWAYRLPVKSLRRIDEAWHIVTSAILGVLSKRRQAGLDKTTDDSPVDLLNCLVSSWTSDDDHGLEENDVIANMFSLMFAGHETTASGIITTLAYLALCPDKQEKAAKEIREVLDENNPSELIDQSKLLFTLYCFWEAQRLYPSANMIPRQLTEDLAISVSHPQAERMHLKEGSFFMFDLIGILRNPHTFPEPEVFLPERWENVSEHDLGAFGFGPRACIGRKFAQTMALAFLSSLLYDWKVEMNLLPGETVKQYEERVMQDAALIGTAFGIKRVPLKLTKRKK